MTKNPSSNEKSTPPEAPSPPGRADAPRHPPSGPPAVRDAGLRVDEPEGRRVRRRRVGANALRQHRLEGRPRPTVERPHGRGGERGRDRVDHRHRDRPAGDCSHPRTHHEEAARAMRRHLAGGAHRRAGRTRARGRGRRGWEATPRRRRWCRGAPRRRSAHSVPGSPSRRPRRRSRHSPTTGSRWC